MESVTNIQTMFVGSFTHSLDAKRRIIFPSTWRNLMAENRQLFAFPHPEEKCIYLYTAAEMTRRLEQLRHGSGVDRMDERAIRSLLASAEMVSWDTQGRLRIGDSLLAHAEVKEQVVLVGTLTRIELWSLEHFDMALPEESALAENVFYGGY